jgi:hypothetical protein
MIDIWTLKVVIPTTVGETLRIRSTDIDVPGWSSVPFWFQDMVRYPFEFDGLQLLVAMLSVNAEPLLRFLT